MNSLVCIAYVPDTETRIRIGADGKSIDESDVKWIVSPYDEYGLEEALKIRDGQGAGTVTVLAVGPERAIAGIVYSACSVTLPGHIHVAGRSRLVLGEPDGTISARAQALAEVLRAGGITMEVSPRMRDEIWRKLLLNMITGPLCVLGQANLNDAHVDPETQAAGRAMLAEGTALAHAMGCEISLSADKIMAGNRGVQHKPSILQDLELGRPMEIDALYVTPLDLARRLGVAMPVFELLVALTRVRARSAGLYAPA